MDEAMRCSECKYWKGKSGDKHCVCVNSVKPCELERNHKKRKKQYEQKKKFKMEPHGKGALKMRF